MTLCGNGGGLGAKTGLYATPIGGPDGRVCPIYEVRDGFITIKGKRYPIKLRDGFYIIRKLTVRECMRLQTVPEEYVFPVSNSQAYKMLGNGWTVDVIAHIMSRFTGLTEEPVEVLSMYDGMSCGHIALDKLGAEITSYHATEIDRFAIQTTQHNFPDTVQLGDAFQVRNDDWRVEECMRDTNLVNALREHAELAQANEWETPITLCDDLAEAADLIEAQVKEIDALRNELCLKCGNYTLAHEGGL